MVVFKCAHELDEVYLAQVCSHSLTKIHQASSPETAFNLRHCKSTSLKLLFALFTSLPIPSKVQFCLKLHELIKNLQLKIEVFTFKSSRQGLWLLYVAGKFLSLITLIHSIFKSLGKTHAPQTLSGTNRY